MKRLHWSGLCLVLASLVFSCSVPISSPAEYTLSVTVDGPGTVAIDREAATYLQGTSITLTATPEGSADFISWSGGYGSANPLTIDMNSNVAITATFYDDAVDLALASVGASASLGASPSGPHYIPGTSVTVTAPDVAGYVFDGWKDGASWVTTAQSNSYTFTISADMTLTAQYTANTTTILVYLDGDNSLDLNAVEDLNEMEAADLRGTGINVVVLLDRSSAIGNDWTGTRAYSVQYSGSTTPNTTITSKRVACAPLGITAINNAEVNMGSPSTLTSFINWGKSAYPAPQNMLIFWNHGSGWRSMPALRDDGALAAIEIAPLVAGLDSKAASRSGALTKALCEDATSESMLATSQLGTAIANNSFDVIGFDLCLGGMIEVAYEVRNKASYMIASEESEPGDGWEYHQWLSNFAGKASKTPIEIVNSVVDAYEVRYSSTVGATLAGYDLSEVSGLYTALNSFAGALSGYIVDATTQGNVFNILLGDTENFFNLPGDCNIDVWDMADKINTGIPGLFSTEATALKFAVESLVVKEWHNTASGSHFSDANENAQGIAIHLTPIYESETYIYSDIHDPAYFADHSVISPSTGYIPSFVDASGNAWVPNYTVQSGLLYKLFYRSYL